MRLLTYVLAAALLWAVAASGPATSDPGPRSAARGDATAPPRGARAAYPR